MLRAVDALLWLHDSKHAERLRTTSLRARIPVILILILEKPRDPAVFAATKGVTASIAYEESPSRR
jgi:hypothetical protein